MDDCQEEEGFFFFSMREVEFLLGRSLLQMVYMPGTVLDFGWVPPGGRRILNRRGDVGPGAQNIQVSTPLSSYLPIHNTHTIAINRIVGKLRRQEQKKSGRLQIADVHRPAAFAYK